MKSVSSLRDLEQFGIITLTGEADALGYRVLCDLTEEGVRVFKECFGMPYFREDEDGAQCQYIGKNGLAENWNSRGIASVMLTRDSVVPLAIIGFYLQGRTVVLTTKDTVFGLEEGEEIRLNQEDWRYEYHSPHGDMPWPEQSYGQICRIIVPQPDREGVSAGTRNVHQFTGRVQ